MYIHTENILLTNTMKELETMWNFNLYFFY